MKNSLLIIQARLSSTRLPNKVLKPIWEEENLLDLQYSRIEKLGIPVVLATTTNPSDDPLVSWSHKNQIKVFRGSEQNVLQRFIDCAGLFGAENLIRICSDNPFLQLDQIPYYLERLENGVKYISYCNEEGTPAIKTHWGLFVEGVKLSALKKAADLLESHPKKQFFQEHVTNFIYGNPEAFKVKLIPAPELIINRKDLRFTVDTLEDFNNMAKLIQILDGYLNVSLRTLIDTVDSIPDIRQKMLIGISKFSK